MKKITINRINSNEHNTLSDAFLSDFITRSDQIEQVISVFEFKIMELPWKDNQRNISCIPADTYQAIAINRASNGKYAIWLKDVPNRSEILIHEVKYVKHLLGCAAPGTSFEDFNNDEIVDIVNSRSIMEVFEQHIPVGDKCIVQLIDNYKISGNSPILTS